MSAKTEMPPMDFMFAPRTFVRVYRLPEKLTDGYCFGGGRMISFLNVDWFEALISEGREGLADYIRTKRYFDPTEKILIIGDHPDFTFILEPEGRS